MSRPLHPRTKTPLPLALAAVAGLGLTGDAGLLSQAPRAAAGLLARAAPLVLALEAQAAPATPAAADGAASLAGGSLALRLATDGGPVLLARASVRAEPIPGEPGAEILVPVRPAPPPAPEPLADRETAVAMLDTRVLERRVGPAAAPHDAFAPRSWAPPAPPAPPPAPAAAPAPPPPAPTAPPLPFKFLGMLDPGDSTAPTVYLANGEQLVSVTPGDVIDNTWRVEGLQGRTLHFTYLPLSQRQSLPLGSITP